MKVQKIYIEKGLQEDTVIENFFKTFKHAKAFYIDDYRDVFEKVKKPYLKKRDSLNIFLAHKKGELVKLAPPAYGTPGTPHYYFVHAYNCIYECTYCYLQGHFQSPDLVFFLNYQEMILEMEKTLSEHSGDVWFHAGEFSDSLALSHLTGEWDYLWTFFQQNPRARLELRTKSVNIRSLLERAPLSNIVVSFSLSSEEAIKKHDLLTPKLSLRLQAMQKLQEHGFTLGLHFDPIIESVDFLQSYKKLLQQLSEGIDLTRVAYLSLGVVRFTKEVFHKVAEHYPDETFLASNLIKAPDQKVRYSRAKRQWILSHIQELAVSAGININKIYWCMEGESHN
jgi:spore photoproduct lyase